jgi:hypothetical protein
MESSEVKEHIAQHLATVDAPGIERCELQQIETTSDTDTGVLVRTTTDVYVRIGECDVLRFPQRATFLLEPTTTGMSVSMTHKLSNRTGGFPASGSRRRLTLSPTEGCASAG